MLFVVFALSQETFNDSYGLHDRFRQLLVHVLGLFLNDTVGACHRLTADRVGLSLAGAFVRDLVGGLTLVQICIRRLYVL
jgi:hypothetical protein